MYSCLQRIDREVKRDYFVLGDTAHKLIAHLMTNPGEPLPTLGKVTFSTSDGNTTAMDADTWASDWSVAWLESIQHATIPLTSLKVVATEQKLALEADTWNLVGTIDMVAEYPNGQRIIIDHKGCNSLPRPAMYMHADLQGSLYCTLAMQHGLIADPLFAYHYYRRDIPNEPTELKKGGLSQAHNQGTDRIRYRQAAARLGIDPEKDALYGQLPEQVMALVVPSERCPAQMTEALWTAYAVVDEIAATIEVCLDAGIDFGVNKPAPNMVATRTITRDGCGSCPYRDICEVELTGGDSSGHRELFRVNPNRYADVSED